MQVEIQRPVNVPDEAVEYVWRRVRHQLQSVGTYRDSRDPRESSVPGEKRLIGVIIAEFAAWQLDQPLSRDA